MVMETQVQEMVAKNLPLSESAICQGHHHCGSPHQAANPIYTNTNCNPVFLSCPEIISKRVRMRE